MNNYEILYILSDKQDADAKKALVDKFKSLVEPYGEVTAEEWGGGSRKLEYPICSKISGRHNTGYYVFMKFTAPPEIPAEMERLMRISDDVLRFMIERV